MDDATVIAEIRQSVAVGDFEIDREHCDSHMFNERFTLQQAIQVVVSGDVIETEPERNRWLFCGTVPTMRWDARFRGPWLHVCTECDEEAKIALVTMYRPLVRLWRTERDQR